MMYSAVIPVRVSLAGGTLRDAVAQVTDQLAEIDELGLREVIVEAWLTQAPKRLVEEFLGETS